MLIGYARVSTDDQNLNLQRDALNGAGCERLFEDHASGSQPHRAGLGLLLEVARAGDTVMVWRLDRLARSLKDLIALVERLDAAGIGLKSLHEQIDTSSSGGKLVFHLFGALAEFERTLIRERTRAGLSAARARGRQGGRPRAIALCFPLTSKENFASVVEVAHGFLLASANAALGVLIAPTQQIQRSSPDHAQIGRRMILSCAVRVFTKLHIQHPVL
jgi:DNA invertase Pin-like site-specific DNA recombinase